MLPATNQEAIVLAMKGSLALGCKVNTFTKFDRKNYFYPDLPMGYQISQYDQPLAEHGMIEVERKDGTKKQVSVTRLHMENDAGKLTHTRGGSLVDFNRSGAPLMEIVSGPDMYSMEEASLYTREIQNILRAVGASECDMEKGMMRFDINISLRPEGREEFGTKVEIKNVNSFKSLEKAIIYEIERQTNMLDAGETIKQETRGWDDEQFETVAQRSKEEAADYRYFPEPDIPPLTFTEEYIASIKASLPELPGERRGRYFVLGLEKDTARILADDHLLAAYFEKVAELVGDHKIVASWITSVLLGMMNGERMSVAELRFTPEQFASVITAVREDTISHLSGKEVLEEMFLTGKDADTIIDAKGLRQVSDTSALESWIDEIIIAFPAQTADYKSGKTALLGFFIGQVVKKSGGSANPKVVGKLVAEKLG